MILNEFFNLPQVFEKNMTEGVMSEIDAELRDIVAREDFDALYELFSANTPAGRYVQDMYDDVVIDTGLHPDDDFERIEQIVFDRLADDFDDTDMAEGAPISIVPGGDKGGAVDNFKQQMANRTELDYQKQQQGMAEGPNDGKEDNFTIDDIKNLERIRDFETLKAQAKELIKGKPARRMKPEKISWFYNHIDTLKNPLAVIKMMYDLMLAGEGNKVIGSRNSMSSNSYRQRFGEQGVTEAKGDYVPPKEADYGPEYQAMVRRVGQKARAQEKARQQQPKAPVRESRLALLKQIIQS